MRQSETLLPLVGITVITDSVAFTSNEKKSDKRADAEQRIRAHGKTHDLSGLTEEEVFSDLRSLDAALHRRNGNLNEASKAFQQIGDWDKYSAS